MSEMPCRTWDALQADAQSAAQLLTLTAPFCMGNSSSSSSGDTKTQAERFQELSELTCFNPVQLSTLWDIWNTELTTRNSTSIKRSDLKELYVAMKEYPELQSAVFQSLAMIGTHNVEGTEEQVTSAAFAAAVVSVFSSGVSVNTQQNNLASMEMAASIDEALALSGEQEAEAGDKKKAVNAAKKELEMYYQNLHVRNRSQKRKLRTAHSKQLLRTQEAVVQDTVETTVSADGQTSTKTTHTTKITTTTMMTDGDEEELQDASESTDSGGGSSRLRPHHLLRSKRLNDPSLVHSSSVQAAERTRELVENFYAASEHSKSSSPVGEQRAFRIRRQEHQTQQQLMETLNEQEEDEDEDGSDTSDEGEESDSSKDSDETPPPPPPPLEEDPFDEDKDLDWVEDPEDSVDVGSSSSSSSRASSSADLLASGLQKAHPHLQVLKYAGPQSPSLADPRFKALAGIQSRDSGIAEGARKANHVREHVVQEYKENHEEQDEGTEHEHVVDVLQQGDSALVKDFDKYEEEDDEEDGSEDGQSVKSEETVPVHHHWVARIGEEGEGAHTRDSMESLSMSAEPRSETTLRDLTDVPSSPSHDFELDTSAVVEQEQEELSKRLKRSQSDHSTTDLDSVQEELLKATQSEAMSHNNASPARGGNAIKGKQKSPLPPRPVKSHSTPLPTKASTPPLVTGVSEASLVTASTEQTMSSTSSSSSSSSSVSGRSSVTSRTTSTSVDLSEGSHPRLRSLSVLASNRDSEEPEQVYGSSRKSSQGIRTSSAGPSRPGSVESGRDLSRGSGRTRAGTITSLKNKNEVVHRRIQQRRKYKFRCDKDKRQRIEFEDFAMGLSLMTSEHVALHNAKYNFVFRFFDYDLDGIVDEDSVQDLSYTLLMFLEQMGFITSEEVNEMLGAYHRTEADKEMQGDGGTMNFEQFKLFCQRDEQQRILSLFGLFSCLFEQLMASVQTTSYLDDNGMSFDVKKSGPLRMRGQNTGALSRFWFTVVPGYLIKYNSRLDTTPVTMYLLHHVHVEEVPSLSSPHAFAFRIHTPKLSRTLVAYTEEEMYEWISTLQTESQFQNPHHSFGRVHNCVNVRWFVDGADTYQAMADVLRAAEQEIFIADWFLSPEVYLNRDEDAEYSDRLDMILKERAEAGVRVYVLLWSETPIVMQLSNGNARSKLESLHSNIRVMVHAPLNLNQKMWSHHQKIVCVDQMTAFVGGLDMCFGRYDTQTHRLVDSCHLATTWPGKDYYNPSYAPMQGVHLPYVDNIDRTMIPRMPWHDVHTRVDGGPAHDVAINFIQRWNHHRQEPPNVNGGYSALIPHYVRFQNSGPMTCQVVRSLGDWAGNGFQDDEASVLNAYVAAILGAEHFVYIEQQFFVSDTCGGGVTNRIASVLYKRICQAIEAKQRFRVIVVLPVHPEGNFVTDAAVRNIMYWQYRTIYKGESSIIQRLHEEHPRVRPEAYITFHSLRTYDVLNNVPVSEQVYVHSKLMIVDDRTVIMGSANINDRSMLGGRDSEIAVVVRSTDGSEDVVQSVIDSNVYMVSDYAHTLRCTLWAEHLGLDPTEHYNLIQDPVCDETYERIWQATSRNNTIAYHQVFPWVPDDTIESFAELNSVDKVPVNIEQLQYVRGQLTDYPRRFLMDEKLDENIHGMMLDKQLFQ